MILLWVLSLFFFQGLVQYFLKVWYFAFSHIFFLLSISFQRSLYKAIRGMP